MLCQSCAAFRVVTREDFTLQRSETIGELAKALAAANGHIKNPNLDAVNPHFKSRYASLGAIINAVRAPLAAHGISAVQTVSNDGGSVGVTTTLLHSSGEWMAETIWSALPDRATVQQLGSSITYLRRYSLAAITGIVGEEDDDGNAGSSGDRNDRPEPRKTFKPTEAKGAPVAAPKASAPPAKAAPAKAEPVKDRIVADAYPEEYAGVFKILRVVARPGKPYAIQAEGEHGVAWIATSVEQYAELLSDTIGNSITLDVERIGDTLQVMRCLGNVKAVKEEVF
jgi:hypothetical protein